MRHAIAVHTTAYTRLPHYTLVTLFDDQYKYFPRDYTVSGDSRRKNLRLSRCGSLTGAAVFLAEISLCLEVIARQWSRSLDDLVERFSMSVIAVLLRPLGYYSMLTGTKLGRLTAATRQELMFDRGDFSKSEQYFTILQTLRLCRDWITETIRDVKSISEKIHEEIDSMREGMTEDDLVDRSQELEHLDAIISRLVAKCEALFQPLLDRIERNNEEIKSLRDGVTHSYFPLSQHLQRSPITHEGAAIQYHISQRSIQGHQPNREQCSAEPLHSSIHCGYYLLSPNEFRHCMVLNGMHLFDPADDASKSRVSFIVTFVVISVGTYVIAAGSLRLVRYREVIPKLFGAWRKPSNAAA
ncbi:hypothetical protein BJY01DRAFT_250311 [Aspergillus pseudoustus]|uniref:Uncharacterized protein n=1 Tax=Aspergillus pseudoustus TaxID=1810923 RepID=A0ABR4JIF8_9EURO